MYQAIDPNLAFDSDGYLQVVIEAVGDSLTQGALDSDNYAYVRIGADDIFDIDTADGRLAVEIDENVRYLVDLDTAEVYKVIDEQFDFDSDDNLETRVETGYTTYRIPVTMDSTSDELVAADTYGEIRVIGLVLVADEALEIQFKDGDSDELSGVIPIDALGSGFVLPTCVSYDQYWMATDSNESLRLVVTNGGTVNGILVYYVAPTGA